MRAVLNAVYFANILNSTNELLGSDLTFAEEKDIWQGTVSGAFGVVVHASENNDWKFRMNSVDVLNNRTAGSGSV